ncbi:MAG: carboxymuconolactone decarboxylase family protein, partial [Pseudomonadota bacterium]
APEAMPDDIRNQWRTSMDVRGDATFFEVAANNPDLLRWYVQKFYGEAFYSDRTPVSVKEIVRLRLSTIHGCRFCNQGNRRAALAAGLTEDQIDGLESGELSAFSPAEQAAIRLADEIALTNGAGRLTPQLYAELSAHYDDGQIFELGLIAGVLAGTAKFLFAFDLVEREETCPFPPANSARSG